MAITDLSVSRTSDAGQGQAGDLASLIQAGKGFLGANPQSGSIIKALSENGFREKITEGIKRGHVYAILHAAPNPNFTLVDTWKETVVDENGQIRSEPRKSYQFFRISADHAVTETPVESPNLPAERGEELSAPKSKPEAPMREQEPFAPKTQPPVSNPPAPENSPRPSWLKQSLDRQKAQATVKANESSSSPLRAFSSRQGTVPSRSLDLLRSKFRDVAPRQGSVSKTPKPANGRQDTESSVAAAPLIFDASKMDEVLAVPKPPKADTSEGASVDKKRRLLESVFGGPVEGIAAEEWNRMRRIPLRPFTHPEDYAWGTDASGRPVSRTLENYPPVARTLRDKILFAAEQLASRDRLAEMMPLDEALDAMASQNVL